MKDSVLDILIHLFENFLDAEDDSTPDREALKAELEQAGYPEAEIERALLWLESLATDPDRALGEGTARAVRVFSGSEQIRLTPTCAATSFTSRTSASSPSGSARW